MLFALLAMLLPGTILAQQAKLIPRNLLFSSPDHSVVRISPDGRMIGFLAPVDGVLNIWVQETDSNKAVPITYVTEKPIRYWQWAKNSEQIIYSIDASGNENDQLFATDIIEILDIDSEGNIRQVLGGGETIHLTPNVNVRARYLAGGKNNPDHILVLLNNRNKAQHDVYKVNTRNGESEMVFQNDRGYTSFIAGENLQVRIATRFSRKGGLIADALDVETDNWYELAKWNHIDATNSSALGTSTDGRAFFLADSRRSDRSQLYTFITSRTGDSAYVALAGQRKGDLTEVTYSPITGLPQAVQFEAAKREWVIIDRSIEDDWKLLEEMSEGEFRIASRDDKDQLWIIAVNRDIKPTSYYLYNRNNKTTSHLFSSRSELNNLELTEMQTVEIRARDGMKLVSYLTTPTGVPRRNLPMILLVHGGPWSRDHWGFNPTHQWLANRGYAVLSVNYRGSTGFGKSFSAAGNRQWGNAMQDDLIDAVLWAVDEGIADPDRVAIMGTSYGGYATLLGLTFTPDFFTCGIDIVGPSNLNTLLASIPPYWEPRRSLFETRIGPTNNPQFLDAISPASRVESIRKPLLIGHGANDPRVKQSESEQIVSAMQEQNLPVTYVLFPDEGHGFVIPENSIAFMAIVENFLAKHMGGRAEVIGNDVINSSAQIKAGRELIPGLPSMDESDDNLQ